MTNDFDWLTEADRGSLGTSASELTKPKSLPRGFWFVLAFIATILCLGAGIAYLWLANRADKAAELSRNDLLRTHQLYMNAVAQRDPDVIDTILTDSDLSWRDHQQELIRKGLFRDRYLLGLEALNDSEPVEEPNAVTVELKPDLKSALVVDIQPYQIVNDRTIEGGLPFERSFLYAREDLRWFPAPIPEDTEFWGEWIQESSQNLTLVYPARDSDIIQAWLLPLSKMVSDLCSDIGAQCPANLDLEIYFDRDPSSIFHLGETLPFGNLFSYSKENRYRLTFPTPTLVGRPVNALGEEALYRGYAALAAATMLANFPETNLDSRSLELAVNRLGLRMPAELPAVLPQRPIAELRDAAEIPAEDVLMLCSRSSTVDLLRLRIASAEWIDEGLTTDSLSGMISGNPSVYVTPAPNHDGALLHIYNQGQADSNYQTYWWRDNHLLLLMIDDRPYYVVPPFYNHEILRKVRFLRVIHENQVESGSTSWIDLGRCLGGPCEIESIQGYPVWSPDGSYTLVEMMNTGGRLSIYLGDAQAKPLDYLGIGHSPFWIDEDRFGFIRPAGTRPDGQSGPDVGQEIVVGQVPERNEPQLPLETVANTDIFSPMIEVGDSPSSVGILSVLVYPDDPESWLIAAGQGSGGIIEALSILELDLQSKELKLLLQLDDVEPRMPLFSSPDNRFVSFVAADGSDSYLYLLDRTTERTIKIRQGYPNDWSRDGRWLMFMDRRNLLLLNPITEEEINIPIDTPSCLSAVWASPE